MAFRNLKTGLCYGTPHATLRKHEAIGARLDIKVIIDMLDNDPNEEDMCMILMRLRNRHMELTNIIHDIETHGGVAI